MAEDIDTHDPQPTLDAQPEEFSDADFAALTARLRQEPAAAQAFAQLQKQGFEVLRKLAKEVMAKLAAMEPPQKAVDAGTDWKRLSGLARDREIAARQRRELAQDLVLGTLVNLDNPDWNPLDPSTSKNAVDSTFLALLNPRLAASKEAGAE
jgi:hypothetical protein